MFPSFLYNDESGSIPGARTMKIAFIHGHSESGDDYYFVHRGDITESEADRLINSRAEVGDDEGCVTLMHIERVEF